MKYRALAVLPGLLTFSILWLLTFNSFEWVPWVDYLYGALWQGLGRHFLTDLPWESLWALHIQPPGLMAIEAVDLAVSPQNHEFLSGVFFLFGAATTILVVDTLTVLGVRQRWSMISGIVFALLPSTVIYTFFPFTTAPTMFACSLALWGVALCRRSLIGGVTASALGVFLLFFFRTSFVWLFALLWIAGLTWMFVRRSHSRQQRIVGLGSLSAVALLIVALQGHYVSSFGTWTTTSWSGENVVKALAQSGHMNVTPQAIAASEALGPCEGALARDIAGGNAPSWLPEHVLVLPGCESLRIDPQTGVEALDSPYKDGVYDGQRAGNFNWKQRLEISLMFTRVATEIIKADPGQMLSMAFVGSESGSRASGLSIYLGPSEDYGWVTGIREVYPLSAIGGVLSLLFAPIALTLTLLSLLLVALRRESGRLRFSSTYWFAVALVSYHLAVSVLFEYGENNRFQAEVAPAWMVLAVMTVWVVTQKPNTQSPSVAANDGAAREPSDKH